MRYVSQLDKPRKLEIFKQVKGLCLWESLPLMPTMREVLDNKVQDVLPIINYDMNVNYMEVYKDYSYGRY